MEPVLEKNATEQVWQTRLNYRFLITNSAQRY